jgi:putative ABC transport system permease protein
MFARLLFNLLRASRGRLAVALVALVSGAAVISALLNLDLDIERKLTQEFRSLGANLVISRAADAPAGPAGADSPSLMQQDFVLTKVQQARTAAVIAAAPSLFIVAQAMNKPVIVAGTWLDEAGKLEPTWKVAGERIVARDDRAHCLTGRDVARQFNLSPGSQLELTYLGNTARLTVSGIVDAGGAEDSHIFVNLPVAQALANLEGRIGQVQLSVSGTPASIETFARNLSAALPGFEVRPIRQVAQGEGELLARIRLLIFSMVLLILSLTGVCVLATMAALAMERREDVGLMKALGGSISRIVALFLAEVGVLGAAGGLLGTIAGVGLSHWMGQRVFGTAISVRWEIFPLTVALMTGVGLLAALPLRRLGNIKPAVILRGE